MRNPIFSDTDAMSAVNADFGRDDRNSGLNSTQVYYLMNTWLGLMGDMGVPIGLLLPLADTVKHIGLRPVCSACIDIAESMLGDMDSLPCIADRRFRRKLTDYICSPIADILDYVQERCAHSESESVRLCLQVLLYPERFTYKGGADEAASLRKFFAVNNKCRELEYDWSMRPSSTLLERMRFELDRILTRRDWYFDVTDCCFSTGSVLEAMEKKTSDPADKSTLAKWRYLSQYVSHVYGVEYPLPGGRNGARQFRAPVLTLVPKSFTSRRVIAPEDSLMNFVGHGYLSALRRMLKINGNFAFINERDQSVNNELARVGSATGEWATIDMSSASDSISKALAFWCVPEWFKPVLLEVCSWNIIYESASYDANHPTKTGNRRVKKLFCLLTSGNSMTWLFESCWFLAIGRMAAAIGQDPNPDMCVFVYGDDMVIRAQYFEIAVQLLQSFGHKVNVRKSFGTGWFRESCGGWYYRGENVTPTFWPRRELAKGKASLGAVLVDLQHKFYTQGWVGTAEWLTNEVLELYPKISRSSLGSDYGDLWDPAVDEYYDSQVRHTVFAAEKKVHKAEWNHSADYIAYVEYLLRGPLYVSEEDRAWGISTSRREALLTYTTDKIVFKR